MTQTPCTFKQWDCVPVKDQYLNGRTALYLIDAEDGESVATATVNVPEIELAEGEVIIKDYSENMGMLDALLSQGIVEDTGKQVRDRYVVFHIAKLLV